MPNHATVRRTLQGVGTLLLMLVLPHVAGAQFHALKSLKNKVHPDSATKAEAAAKDSAAKDSVARVGGMPVSKDAVKDAAKGAVAGDSTSKRSRLARVASKAVAASQKFQDVTGVSVKDAALMATGVGAGAVVAKKLGVDPTSMASKSLSHAAAPRSPTMPTGAMTGATPSMGVMPNMASMGTMPTMPASARRGSGGVSDADAKLVMDFQQEAMRVSTAASRGDPDAKARLESLQAIQMKYQPEMQRLSMSASTGDTAAVRRLTVIQFDMMREWLGKSTPSAKSTKPAAKAAKSGTP